MPAPQLEILRVQDATLDSVPGNLPVGVVHLWQRSLQASVAAVDASYEMLSPDEREKASKYRVERPRADFILTRGTLRALLARYLHTAADNISFNYTQYGKPHLNRDCDLQFNVSHSEGLALMGFVRKHKIGVDVERVRPQSDVRKLAERFFSERERSDLRALSEDEIHAAFFRCWTRKEAYIKAKGEGLSLPLHQFDVSISPTPGQALLATRPDSCEVKYWLVRDVSTIAGYAAAVAVSQEIGG